MIRRISNAYLSVSAADMGAELQSVRAADGTEFIWQGDGRFWADRAPNLFPFTGRLIGGRYEMDGREYSMRIHGLTPYAAFREKYNDGTRLVMELESDEATMAVYPRHFVFQVIYELEENMLKICYRVENRDTRAMFFGLGGHPGFNVPLEKGLHFEDYRLRFEPCAPKRVLFSPDCFVSGETEPFPLEPGYTLPLRHGLFDDDAIFLEDAGRSVTLESAIGRASVNLSFPQMSCFGVWHMPGTDAPYVCLEPWCSLPARANMPTVFETHPGLIRLEPDAVYENRWSITFNT